MSPTDTGSADLILYSTPSAQQRRGKPEHWPWCEPGKRVGRLHCDGCAQLWGRDRWLTVVRALAQYSGRVGIVSVTAPGSDLLPWACAEDHQHSGQWGCMVVGSAAEAWNGSASWRWSLLWRRVSNRLKLEGSVILAKVWEPQRRGVGHLHLVIGVENIARVVALLRELGPDYGFGFIDDGSRGRRRLRPGATGADAGRYVASYIGDGGKVAGVLGGIRDGVIPSRTFYVANALTRRSGCTMRSLRLRRRAWACLEGLCAWPSGVDMDEWVELLVEVSESIGERGPPDA